MELEFDKEIDALLRKARSPSAAAPAAPAAPAGGHLDADEFAAFAENALPDRSRRMYIAHLADCDACRKTLSGFISTIPAAAHDAAFDAAAPAVVKNVPWFRRLLAIPSLVYTLGGLLLVFSGFVGLLVYQSRQSGHSAEVSKVTEKAPVVNQPAFDAQEPESSEASAANSAANSSSSPIDGVTKSGVEVGSADTVVPEEKQPPVAGQDDTVAGKTLEPSTADTAAAPAQKPAAEQPAAAPPPKDAPIVTSSDAKLDVDRNRDKSPELARGEKTKEINAASGATADDEARRNANDALKKSEDKDMRSMREAPAPTTKTGPSRIEGPRQNQAQVATQNNEMQTQNSLPINGRNASGVAATVATRSVGGKTFTFRSGVWYDSEYSGGGTKDVRRGTDKYQKLDEGLRSVADSISGTVVVVWKGTSYKIR
jgi:hypothetical protein